jgi:hypothetical protein
VTGFSNDHPKVGGITGHKCVNCGSGLPPGQVTYCSTGCAEASKAAKSGGLTGTTMDRFDGRQDARSHRGERVQRAARAPKMATDPGTCPCGREIIRRNEQGEPWCLVCQSEARATA